MTRADRAQHHQLADAIILDQPFAERVVDRKQADAQKIEADAKARGSGAKGRHRILEISRVLDAPTPQTRAERTASASGNVGPTFARPAGRA